jgi:hypothetical protein
MHTGIKMADDDDFVIYDKLIDVALRTVVRETLLHVAEHGLPGQHHIYLSFQTDYPGVMIADYLHQEYPDEMTIILQHRFWDLEVSETNFTVGMTFNKLQERLEIPFDAITRFSDPSVQFGLQFQTPGQGAANLRTGGATAGIDLKATDVTASQNDGGDEAEPDDAAEGNANGEAGADVVTLDSFRKK